MQANFRQLRGFTGTGFPGNNHHLVLLDQLEDFARFIADRQPGRWRFVQRIGEHLPTRIEFSRGLRQAISFVTSRHARELEYIAPHDSGLA